MKERKKKKNVIERGGGGGRISVKMKNTQKI